MKTAEDIERYGRFSVAYTSDAKDGAYFTILDGATYAIRHVKVSDTPMGYAEASAEARLIAKHLNNTPPGRELEHVLTELGIGS